MSPRHPTPLPPAGPGSGGAAPAAPRRRWAVPAGLFLALVLAAGVLTPLWRRHEMLARLRAGVPALPNRAAMPELLARRLEAAQARIAAQTDVGGAVAEMGRLYHASGYNSEAETCWRLLQAAQPRDAHWSYYLADLRRAAGDYAEAAALLARTTELAPDYAPAWLHLAEIEFKTGRLDEAARHYQRRLALLPGDPYARLGLARIALLQKRRDEARTLLAQLTKDAPEFSPGHNLYAEMLAADGDAAHASGERWLGRESGRFREAADPWLDELGAWCYNYDRLCIRGMVDYQTKYGDRGKACFERAIQLRPDVLTGYDLLGSLYLELKDAAKARDILEFGLQRARSPQPAAMYYVTLSRAYRELKQPAEAVRVARLGLAQVGEQYELDDALGVALGDLGRHQEAVDALRAAVARNPGDTNANYNLAVALLAVRDLEGAMAALHRSLKLEPTFPASLALLAQIEMDSGRWQAAAQYLQPLYDSHPEMPQAKRLMAAWRLHAGTDAQGMGDYAAAERHFRSGLVIAPDDPELQASLGALYLIQQRFADALKPLEAYRRLRPDDPQSSLFLGQAYAATGRLDEARRVLRDGVQIANRAGNAETARYCQEILQQLP